MLVKVELHMEKKRINHILGKLVPHLEKKIEPF